MDKQWIFCFLLLFQIQIAFQKSSFDSTFYKAAVVEFPAVNFQDVRLSISNNSEEYVKLIETAGKSNVDIIVFPECGITSINFPKREELDQWTTLIPKASDNYIPCINDTVHISEALTRISCAARKHDIYVVINIAEKLPCIRNNEISCPADEVLYYNSNVVFDRNGKIIAKYRKTKLFAEPQFNVTLPPEVVTFQTDFGVKFGTFICFDILYPEPALNLTRQLGVTDIVYPVAWFSEAPFITAVQTQAAWSYAEDVNLLAAGYNRPSIANGGSGIYLGRRGIGKAILPTHGHKELLIFEVPKIKRIAKDSTPVEPQLYHFKSEHPSHVFSTQKDSSGTSKKELRIFHDNFTLFNSLVLDAKPGIVYEELCHNEFCCKFNMTLTTIDNSMAYRLVAFNGIRTYAGVNLAGTSTCAIVQCANRSLDSCGSLENSQTTFKYIEINNRFQFSENSLIMPNTLTSSLLPVENWTFFNNNEAYSHTIRLYKETKNIVAFGLYARNFIHDGLVDNSTDPRITGLIYKFY